MADKQTTEYERSASDARRRAAAAGDRIFKAEWLKVAEMWELLANEHRALQQIIEPLKPQKPR